MRWRSLIGLAAPARELRAMLDAMVPATAQRQWVLAARLQVPDGRIIVFDPVCYWPHEPDPQHVYDLVLDGPPGEVAVHLEVLRISRRHLRIAAVKILWAEKREGSEEQVGEVSVDSATLAISAAAELPRRWRVGGPRNRSSLLVPYGMEEQERKAETERALKALAAKGFRIRRGRDDPVFVSPLDDREIALAVSALKDAGSRVRLYTNPPHSGAIIADQIQRSGIAVVDDRVSPWLVAFTSGWGDGTYPWYVLKDRDGVYGFSCRLMGPDD